MEFDPWSEAARLGEAGESAALVTVIRTTGSVPRRAPAKMIVRADGACLGTVGGGRVELEVAEIARGVATGARAATRVEKHLVRDLAMCCGGSMEFWVEPLDGSRWKAMGEAARRRAKRRAVAVWTAFDGPGGKDLRPGDECLAARAPRLEDQGFAEPLFPPERLVMFGAGHVAHATAALAAKVGFECVVCDEDENFATESRFPGARLLHTFDVRDVARELDPLGAGDYALILTRDHAVDQAILEQILPRDGLAYLGMIGSEGKLGRFRRRLEAKGIGGAADWARLRSPVGLDIGAESPEEIAVAIVGELIRVRAGQ